MRLRTLLLSASAAAVLASAANAQTRPSATPPDETQDTVVREVVVTAAPFAVPEDALITNVDVLTADELAVARPGGLGEVLSDLPGLRSTFFGPGASRPVIRGLSGPRVLVLTNGVGLIDASALSPDHQVASDPAEATRIEVLRGPSALRYGGSAIGGVVNILDERVPERIPVDGIDGRLSAQASSVDDGRSLSGGITAGTGPLVFTVDGVHRESDDYRVPVPPESRRQAELEGEEPEPAERVENSAVELSAFGVGASYVSDRGFVGLSVRRTDTLYGVPGHAHGHEHHEEEEEHEGEDHDEHEEDEHEEEVPVTIDLVQTRFDFRGEWDLALGPFEQVRWNVGVADYEHTEFEGDEVGTRFLSEGWEGRLELIQAERNGWNGAVGFQALARDLDAVGEEAYVPRTEVSEIGAFTVQRLDRDTHGFEAGLRLDRRTLETAEAERDFTNLSASAGAFVRPADGVFLGLAVSRNARAPTEAELFADGPHVATRGFEIGDADIDSEVAYTAEGTVHLEQGRFDADLHLFVARYEGFIDLRPTGEEEDELDVFQYVQTDASFHGFEAEAAYELWRDGGRSFSVEAAADYVRGETDLGPPARIPPWSVTARLVYADPRLTGRFELRRVAAQNRVAEFELPTDDYTLANAFASWRPFADRRLTLFAEARNIGDAEAREHVSFLKDLAPLPGRNFRVGLAYRF